MFTADANPSTPIERDPLRLAIEVRQLVPLDAPPGGAGAVRRLDGRPVTQAEAAAGSGATSTPEPLVWAREISSRARMTRSSS